ncbi:MAG TPA: ABC transporter permease subunit [Micromonosporaceae bacterium]|nr:ABC transporter permease subunit [Micromonosporaceae bacterium]
MAMLGNVFLKSLRDQRRALVGWGAGIVAFIVLEAALWPSVSAMPELEELLAGYPEAMRELFGLEEFATGAGFLNAELFSAMLPLLFIVFGISRGARAIAGEEEAGTLEVLLSTRVSPAALLLQQAAVLGTAVSVLGVLTYGAVLASSVAFGMGVGAADLAGAVLAMVLLGVEFGWLALAIGAATGRRGVAIGLAAAAAVASYLLYAAGTMVAAVEPWLPLSPFFQALDGGPLGAGLPAAYGWLALVPTVVVAAALPVFDRRDIRVH